jgi:hypoxanthine phosphoribosyltransferase
MKQFVVLFSIFTSFCWGVVSDSPRVIPEPISDYRNDPSLELLISPEDISSRIQTIAAQIDNDYQGEELTIVVIMKGAMCITVDLMRQLHIPVAIQDIKTSSFKGGTKRGELGISRIEGLNIAGKNVLVVDDIFDSGTTMTTVMDILRAQAPKSVQSLVLLLKQVPRTITYRPEYVLFEIPNRFVLGYGLDYKEFYRNLPGVYAFVNDTPSS